MVSRILFAGTWSPNSLAVFFMGSEFDDLLDSQGYKLKFYIGSNHVPHDHKEILKNYLKCFEKETRKEFLNTEDLKIMEYIHHFDD